MYGGDGRCREESASEEDATTVTRTLTKKTDDNNLDPKQCVYRSRTRGRSA